VGQLVQLARRVLAGRLIANIPKVLRNHVSAIFAVSNVAILSGKGEFFGNFTAIQAEKDAESGRKGRFQAD
jgi:hypothetical protein